MKKMQPPTKKVGGCCLCMQVAPNGFADECGCVFCVPIDVVPESVVGNIHLAKAGQNLIHLLRKGVPFLLGIILGFFLMLLISLGISPFFFGFCLVLFQLAVGK